MKDGKKEETRQSEYVKSKEACEITGLTDQTLRKYADTNKIKTYKTVSGQRMYSRSSLKSFINNNDSYDKERKKIIYCRVSSRNQLDDLERQCSSLQSRFPNHELIKDCGSGLNFKRKGLRTVLEHVMSGNVEEVVVAHKDRLCRFGFDLIEFICSYNNCNLIVLGAEECKSREQELAEDLMSIITMFSCREYGRRKYKRIHDEDDKTLSNQEPT